MLAAAVPLAPDRNDGGIVAVAAVGAAGAADAFAAVWPSGQPIPQSVSPTAWRFAPHPQAARQQDTTEELPENTSPCALPNTCNVVIVLEAAVHFASYVYTTSQHLPKDAHGLPCGLVAVLHIPLAILL